MVVTGAVVWVVMVTVEFTRVWVGGWGSWAVEGGGKGKCEDRSRFLRFAPE